MLSKGLDRLTGKFIVFDGVDGAGKGEQIRLMAERLTAEGIDFVQTRDPGGTAIGDRIRHVLFDYDLSRMDVRCEALLFMASRAQLARDVIDPALADGRKCVICDRYISATCAYQGAAGFDPKQVIELARFAVGKTWPHLTIIIDLPVEESFGRIGIKAGARTSNKPTDKLKDYTGQVRLFHDTHIDAMEARPLEYHRRVREMFLELPKYYPAPVVIIDGAGAVEQVHQRVLEAIAHAAF